MRIAGLVLAVIYAVLLLPILILGAVGYADYAYLGCPSEAIAQCGDARSAMQFVIVYLMFGVIAFATFWLATKVIHSQMVTR